jgi:hypothetical protein
MDHGVNAAERLALKVPIAETRKIAERDLNVHAMTAEPARVANEGPHVVAGAQQQR